MTTDEHAERFTMLRPLLFTIGYEILGSATEADDVLQDSYLRWAAVDLATVRDTKSYLAQLVTRQALNTVRANVRRREDYVGPWLPEPLLLDERDASADVVLAESVSMAMLVLLETLTPDERAVFVLREVFETPYDEIAEAVDKTPAAVRQIAHRAREHVAARRPRVRVSRAEQDAVVERFLAAVRGGDLQGLLDVLAPDVIVIADGGGLVAAARRPIVGAGRVAAALSTLARLAGDFEAMPMWLNGGPAMRLDIDGELKTVASLVIEDSRITRIYAVVNPQKLTRLGEEASLSR